MTGTPAENIMETPESVQVTEAGREWLHRWGERLQFSAPLGPNEDAANLAPEEEAEMEVREGLAEQVNILGTGMDRIAFSPPEYVEVGENSSDGEHTPFFATDTDTDEVVVKLPRPSMHITPHGASQNEAEEYVWSEAKNGELFRFNGATMNREKIPSSLFAPVLAASDEHEWLVMERFDTIHSVFDDTDKRDEAEAEVAAVFLEADLRPDLDPTNIGVRENGDFVIIDYGLPNWMDEHRVT